MKKTLAALTFLVLLTTLLSFGPSASAKTLDVPYSTFGVRIVQQATDGDRLQFFGLDQLSAFPAPSSGSFEDLDLFGSDSDSRSGLFNYSDERSLFQAVESALGLNYNTAQYSELSSAEDGGDYADTEVEVDTHTNVFAEDRGTFKLSVDIAALQQVAQKYEISQFTIGVCPLHISGSDTSSRQSDAYDGGTGCSWWAEKATPASSDTITYQETPKASPYWHLIGWLVIAVAITTAVMIGLALLLRRKLSTLRTANLVFAAIGAFAAWLATTIAVFALYGSADSLDEFALAQNLTGASQLFSATAPSLLFMIPFLIFVVVLISVPSPDFAHAPQPAYTMPNPTQPMPGGPGIPTWMSTAPGNPTGVMSVPGPQWSPSGQPPLGKNQWQPNNAVVNPVVPGQWAPPAPPTSPSPPPAAPVWNWNTPQQPADPPAPPTDQGSEEEGNNQDSPPPPTWHPPA